MAEKEISMTPIPTQWVGPLKISGNTVNESIQVPLATYETPLWPSCQRGARVSQLVEKGIQVNVLDACMTRSIVLYADDALTAFQAAQRIVLDKANLQLKVSQSSQYAKLKDIHYECVGNLLYLRFSFFTADASGHNMATKAADALMSYILDQNPDLNYGSISGNYCIDKKASAVNGILGRGRRVIADILIPQKICEQRLRTTADKMLQLNIQKNLIGSNLAGSIRSANAHFANMLLAFYLATGQDAANIIEGSQGIVHIEDRQGDLYFSCSLPNLIVGTVGNGKGKDLSVVESHLQALGCRENRDSGDNANRLAVLCAAVVLCGELSLMAAQTNPGELMRAHEALERKK